MALPVLNSATYELEIPSTGERIKYRPFVVKEEKVLLTVLESQDMEQVTRTLRDVIEACTFGKVKISDLAMFDLEYLFLKIRAKSVGESAKILLACEKCEEQNEVSINLTDLELKGNPKATSKIQLSPEVGITMKYPTVHRVEQIMTAVNKEGNAVDVILGMIGASIDTIFDAENVYDAKDHKAEEIMDFIESLNKTQFEKVQEFFEEFPKLKEDVSFGCTKCGTANNVTLEGMADFFG
jgi:hypothetical protein